MLARERAGALRTMACATVLSLLACGRAPDPLPPLRAALDEAFETEVVITLGEDPQDSIATPGIFRERADGGFLLSDRQLPRVRSYDARGRLEAAFGRFGEGPFEFRRINGLTETARGRVAVLGSAPRLTYLTANLVPDTIVQLPGIPSGIEQIGSDLLVGIKLFTEATRGVSRFVQQPRLLHRLVADEIAWSAYTFPFIPLERPYWASLVRFSFDVAGDSIYMAYSLRYPVTILNAAGDSIGAIGVPPGTFQPVPVFEPGAFNPGAYPTQMPELLGGRGTISHIAVVGSHLVVVHGRFGYPESGGPFGAYHSSLDIYDRYTGRKLYEEVPLPEDSRVLGGGRHLYLLQNSSFPPWRIAKLSLRVEKPS